MTSHVVAWFIGSFTFCFLMIAGCYLYGYHVGYDHGLVKYGWCGLCLDYHGNDKTCVPPEENA
jgi:hypothetical protein